MRFETDIFMCRVPEIATYTDEEIESNMHRQEEYDGSLTAVNLQQLVTVGLTTESILRIHSHGHSIRIIDKDDVKVIFNLLHKHKEHLITMTRSVNGTNTASNTIAMINDFMTEISANNPDLIYEKVDMYSNVNRETPRNNASLSFITNSATAKREERRMDITTGKDINDPTNCVVIIIFVL